MEKKKTSLTRSVAVACVSVLCVTTAYAANMNSGNYSIQNDSINFGGTENGTSTNYSVSDTLGEVATGQASSTNYNLSAGYRMMQNSFISISAAPDVALPDITGMGGENSLGSSAWKVITDNTAGYQVYIKADTAPALKDPVSTAFFSDYAPVGSDPDYFFTVGASQSAFGFTAEGTDIVQKFKDDGANCGTGSFDTQDRCWDGLSMTDKVISSRSSPNQPAGTITTVKYKAAVGNNKIQDSGAYRTSVSVTAVAL